MQSLIPPFEGVTEGMMSFLASRPENWHLWTLEEFSLQTWSFFPATQKVNLRRARFRGLLSLSPPGESRLRAVSYVLCSSPSAKVLQLLREGSQVRSKRDWLRFVRDPIHDASVEDFVRELSTLDFSRFPGALEVRWKLLLFKRKDSKGRFEQRHRLLRWELWLNKERIFSGSTIDFAQFLCV